MRLDGGINSSLGRYRCWKNLSEKVHRNEAGFLFNLLIYSINFNKQKVTVGAERRHVCPSWGWCLHEFAAFARWGNGGEIKIGELFWRRV